MPTVRTHLIVNCVLVFFTLSAVFLRLYSRFKTSANLWVDDYLILLAMPLGITMLAIQGLYAPLGVGHPVEEALPNLPTILRLTISYALIYTFCISLIKMSVLFFYLRVFVNPSLRLATKISIANVLVLFFLCRPFKKNYILDAPGECGDQPTAFISTGVYNIITDIAILLLPIPTIWALKTKRNVKIGLTGVFAGGLVVSCVAVVRIIALKHLDLARLTDTMVWVDFLSTAEVNLGILCVCLPMLGPVFLKRKDGIKPGFCPKQLRCTAGTWSKSKRSSGRKRTPDSIALESIFALDTERSLGTKLCMTKCHSSSTGSEAPLNPKSKPGATKMLDNPFIVEEQSEIY
ncbi:unnamed protein product [Clonostachys rosea f. rosea IK726]|uniref:Rhodopsin domain-containing protein n=2 Tax=Bionectria ochroleuca TaxID=29856 RepID=A0A0B7JWN2_BIOOC|nr:unnamed protein product [Clonostachys rosea f. rosea IK726]